MRLPARCAEVVPDDRSCPVLLQSLVNLPNELLALFLVGFSRLLVEDLLDLTIAIAGVIPLRPAGVVLVELLVGIVDAADNTYVIRLQKWRG
jgi:hypothetical protein